MAENGLFCVGCSVLLFLLHMLWTLGATMAFCRAVVAAVVRAHYRAQGAGRHPHHGTVTSAVVDLTKRHIGSLLAVPVLCPVSRCLHFLLAYWEKRSGRTGGRSWCADNFWLSSVLPVHRWKTLGAWALALTMQMWIEILL